ncbi:uncharacterized protein LOC143911589 [Arctopsyche grandis]|uniref:uncharacterized protein LOC143911589 n=1 Tax=Arctopsyche grandis TaxID=121162 RepID=UPI00406D70C3
MGCGVTLKLLIFILSMNLSIGRAAEREQDVGYVADPVGNPLSKPSRLPAAVGSPSHLIRPDRYEFYTFDETGELIKRLMTLAEIQAIIATGDGDDGHMLTIAQTDSSKPPVTFNFQPPTHVKVHTIVNSVQNVLKAEMEAHKTNPTKPIMFDTPDVSSSWSMILPAIFGNTGGSIAPDSMISSHLEPETDVIHVQNGLEDDDEMFDEAEEEYVTTIAPMHREEEVTAASQSPAPQTKKTTQYPTYERISSTAKIPQYEDSITSETKTSEFNIPTTVKISTLSFSSSEVPTSVKPVAYILDEKITEKSTETPTKYVPILQASPIRLTTTDKSVITSTTQKETDNYSKIESITDQAIKSTAATTTTSTTTTTTTSTTPKTVTTTNIEPIKQSTIIPVTIQNKATTTVRPTSTTTPKKEKVEENRVNSTVSIKNVTKIQDIKEVPKVNATTESKKPEKIVMIPVKVDSDGSRIPIFNMSDIINKIAMDLNNDNSSAVYIRHTTTSTELPKTTTTTTTTTTSTTTTTTQKPTTTTQKPTTTTQKPTTTTQKPTTTTQKPTTTTQKPTTTTEKQTTTTEKQTTTAKITTSAPTEATKLKEEENTEKVTVKATESTTLKSNIKLSPTTEKLVSTHRPIVEEELAFIKILPILINSTSDIAAADSSTESTVQPNKTTLESESTYMDDDYLELTNPTTISDYSDATKPDFDELSGSITDLISQIVEDSNPTHIPVTDKVVTRIQYSSTTTLPTTSPAPIQRTKATTTTTEAPVKLETKTVGTTTEAFTEKPSPLVQEFVEIDGTKLEENPKNSSLLIIVEDFDDSSQSGSSEEKITTEDIVPTTYRPVPLYVRSTKPPTPNTRATTSAPLIKIQPNNQKENITYVKIENIKATTPAPEILTTIPPTEEEEEEFEEDVELVTGDTFIDYDTATDTNEADDAELMAMINQVSQMYQIPSDSQTKSEEQAVNKKTAYKKTDVPFESTLVQVTTEKRTSGEESANFQEVNITNKSNLTELSQNKVKVQIQSKISIDEELESKNNSSLIEEKHNLTDVSQKVLANNETVMIKQNESNDNKTLTIDNYDKVNITIPEDTEKIAETTPQVEVFEEISQSSEKLAVENQTASNEHINISSTTEKADLVSTTRLPTTLNDLKSTTVTTKYDNPTTQQIVKTTERYISTPEVSRNTEQLPSTTTAKTIDTTLSSPKLDHIVPVIVTETRVNSVEAFSDAKNDTWEPLPTVASSSESTTTTTHHKVNQNIPQKINTIVTHSQNIIERVPTPDSKHEYHQAEGLEKTTAALGKDVYEFSQLCNELAFKYWESVSSNGVDAKRSLVVSPFAVTSLLAMMFLGARGATSGEMNDILKLDDMVTFNPHIVFKNVTESIEVSKKAGVATSAFVRELYSDKAKGRLLSFYKDRVQQFYSGHVEEINFNSIGDIVRRRTNLLVKRQTWGKIPEYIKGNNMMMRPPLSVFSANVFQTDCSAASTEGRNGEMYFVVSPSIRQRRLVPVPAVLYSDNFLAGYVPEIDATVAAIGGGEQIVSTILIMPGQQGSTAHGDDIVDLQRRIIETSFKDNTWSKLLRSLTPRPGLELQIPRFSHRSVENGSYALQRMGLRDLFTPDKADLRGLNGQSNDLYLSDMTLVNTFTTCGEGYVAEQHHVEVYPGEANKAQRRLWRTPHRPVIQDIFNAPVMTELLEEPRDYQRAFHDPLHDSSYLSMPLHLRPRQARLPEAIQEAPKLKFDRPFMFFVRHNPTGLILHMGRYNPRLLP